MSGGVDSSAAAALLAGRGRPLLGVTMKLWDCALHASLPAGSGACCSPRDAADASRVAAKLGIDHLLLDLGDEFRRLVLEPFCREYAAGRTPSPCIACNRLVKFGALLERLRPAGCELVATGHYARLQEDAERGPALLRAASPERDQSYFLSGLSAGQLRAALFPVGALAGKDEVRRLTASLGLKTSAKPSSQEFCFAPDGDYEKVLARFAPEALEPGPLVDSSGRTLGEHGGIGRYTIGQRRGLGVATGHPLYVQSISAADRTVVVGPDEELFAAGLVAEDVNWIAAEQPAGKRCTVRIRHTGSEIGCTLSAAGESRLEARFDAPVRAVAPGQWACFYDGERVLGGGTIRERLR
ncbi:MAG: tRNA 2-thiouridine(34) synthase MnmA [Planctomycetota bacterium]|jgi:tRNA-specific 2-thiouridylase